MGHFLYYIPNVPAASEKDLAEAGAAHVGPVKIGQIDRGPDGNAGILLANAAANVRLRVDAENTRWIAPAAGRKFAIGYRPDDPPGPEELLRDDAIGGRPVRLADGNEWIVPVARFASAMPTTELGVVYGVTDGGEPTSTIAAAQAELWDMAGELMEMLFAEAALAEEQKNNADAKMGDEAMTPERGIEIATAALAANYRVTEIEVRALEILSAAGVAEIHRTLIDLEGYVKLATGLKIAVEKKKPAAE